MKYCLKTLTNTGRPFLRQLPTRLDVRHEPPARLPPSFLATAATFASTIRERSLVVNRNGSKTFTAFRISRTASATAFWSVFSIGQCLNSTARTWPPVF
jgi:hypothetical protein